MLGNETRANVAAGGPHAAQPQGLPLVVFDMGAVSSVSGILSHKLHGLWGGGSGL